MPSPASSTPPEIWRLIFRLATASDTSYDVDYSPFQAIQELHETAESQRHEDVRLQTCVALMRVSRRFRAVAAEFLYEDVRILDARGLESFLAGLARSARDDTDDSCYGYGHHVRRLELPCRRIKFTPRDTSKPSQPVPTYPIVCDPQAPRLLDVLERCPRLEILVRPCLRLDAETISFWASLVAPSANTALPSAPLPLAHLRRLEWHETELDPRFYGPHSAACLRALVGRAPALRYLFLTSDRPAALADLPLPRDLHTLRFNRSHSHYHPMAAAARSTKRLFRPRTPTAAETPALRHLVLHTTLPSATLDFISAAGAELKVLELAFAPQMSFSAGQLRRVLLRTPAVEELVYHLGAPEISPLHAPAFKASPEQEAVQAPSVRRVRLKVDPDEWNPCKPVLRNQMEVLEGPSFPGLREVVLHGATTAAWFLKREVGRDMLRRMVRRGCAVCYENGEPVSIPG